MKYLYWLLAVINLIMSFICFFNNEHIGTIAYLGCALGWQAMAEIKEMK